MRKGRCPLNPAPPGALAGALPPGSRIPRVWLEIIGAQGALPLEPRPAGGPGRGLASRRAWQGPSHRPAAKFRRGALFEACDEATDAPTDEQASGVAPDAERSEAIQNQGRRATGAREIAN